MLRKIIDPCHNSEEILVEPALGFVVDQFRAIAFQCDRNLYYALQAVIACLPEIP